MNVAPVRSIQAVVFAEGGSLRLRPLTEHLPTCLVPVGGTPILDQQLQALFRVGVRTVTVVGGYRAIQVEQACRIYSGVRFRVNPRFTRGEPHRSSLLAAGLEAEGPCLLLRGDLVFEDALISGLLELDSGDAHVVGASGRGLGIYRLGAETLRHLLEAAGTVPAGAQNELFPWIESMIAQTGSRAIPIGTRAWARVTTMEDLARALKACRDSRSARVAETEDRLRQGNETPETSSASVPKVQDPTLPFVDSTLPAMGLGSLSRTLLRVFPR